MSIAKNASRFDFLPDDAGDPFETASKKNKKKDRSGSGGGDSSKSKSGKKNNSNSDRKQLQSLAFGSASEGKKKNSSKASGNVQQNGCNSFDSGQSSIARETHNSTSSDGKEEKNGNCSDKVAGQRPKGISKEQWEQWQKRDANFADETYVTDLQNALLQSKLEFESEQKNKPPGKGKKKKPMAVPLTEFNARLTEGASSNASNSYLLNNGNVLGQNPLLGNHNYQAQQTYETDEELVERFRMEAKLEIERERQKAIERQLLMSRQPPPSMRANIPASSQSVTTPSLVDEKDLLISRLTEENLHLKGEVDMLKDRVKSINAYLQAAQEVKDKAKLIYELDNMTKANSDLNEELRQTHSQLEQEKSRSSAAMLELRRLLENRRRTTTDGSTS